MPLSNSGNDKTKNLIFGHNSAIMSENKIFLFFNTLKSKAKHTK